ncbi:hypothetical protein GCM10022223_52780 [Kineosporia mesophila]|uniref:Uncharacterized protein n=1 Tax=Kineosporia mesophila TaxID=566012 RepID=A0ABP7ABG3_9ACTN
MENPEGIRISFLRPKEAGGSEELAGHRPNDRFCAETTQGRWAVGCTTGVTGY